MSIGTVDRVLHNRSGVAQATKEKVLKVIEELNYQPNIIARRLVSKKKYVFAVLIPTPTEDNPYWNLHEAGIKKAEAEILQLGIFIERLPFNQSDPKSYFAQTKKVIAGNYDGVLLVPFFQEKTEDLIDHCKAQNIPCVFFDTNFIEREKDVLTYIGQDAFRSGYFAGNLTSYLLSKDDTALAVSINAVKKADNHVNYLQREEGFKKYFQQDKRIKLETFHYNNPGKDDALLEKKLLEQIKGNETIKAIFVTNSRAYKVASILEKNKIKDIKILGYDLIDPNIQYLKKGFIDFLISQEPFNQGYMGIMSLYNHLILNQEVEQQKLMPITLITKENLEFYKA
ncbi:MAG: substrate-binding domain-containing protein [Cytophagaceae bacterium]|nr:substrate-binding domain-containing protein [Cytophagaceae bacterium]